MLAQLRNGVSRVKKFEVVYLVICLCLQSFCDVSSNDSFSKNVNSSLKFKDSSHNTPVKSSKQGNTKSDKTILARNSRATSELELPPMFSESDNELEVIKDISLDHDSKSFNKAGFLQQFPRIGKSNVDPNLLMPYPDSWLIPYLPKPQSEFNEINAPSFGVDEEFEASEYFSEERDDEDSVENEETISSDNEEFQTDSITERQTDSNGTLIPYPRLGKRDANSLGENTLKFNQNLSTRIKRTVDSIIPQIRYGRSTQTDKFSKPVKQSLYILPNYRPGRSSNNQEKYIKYDKNAKHGILPYPRPGRSNGESLKRQADMLPQTRFGRSFMEDKATDKIGLVLKLNPLKNEKSTEELKKSGESQLFVIPYPRPGKRFFGTKPLPPNVNPQIKEKEYVSSENIGDKEEAVATFLVPYPRPGRSQNRKQYLIPNARFGKAASDTMLPLPRYGRSGNNDLILPYPRPGRSETLIPHARFGRSNLLPYPRLGRSSLTVLPYPRPGRSAFSASIIPQMRVGKSTSIIPQMRVGKSTSIIPQIRVGKSTSIIPQIRVGKSTSIIPQIRVGKSSSGASIIPQMRVGKSSNSFPLPEIFLEEDGMPEVNNLDYSEEETKQLQGSDIKSSNFQTDLDINGLKSAVLIPAKKLQKHMLTGNSDYMLPYPRPGRFV